MKIARAHILLLTVVMVAVVFGLWTIATTARGSEQVSRSQDEPVGIWRHIGPIPIIPGDGPKTPARYNSGRVVSISADPSDSKHWLAGGATGGVWATSDAGQTWTSNTDALPSLAIGAIAFAPSNPAVVYAGTGEASNSRDARAGVGILKSLDGGANWNLLAAAALKRAAVAVIRVSPTNPDIVLAGTARGSGNGRFSEIVLGATPLFGVLRSTDGGATWSRMLPGQATAIEADPNNFDRQFAAISDVLSGQTNDSPGSRPNGIYRSADGGQNWSAVDGPWNALRPGRLVPAIAPSNPNVLYVSVSGLIADGAQANTVLGLYRTDDAWSATPSWVRISTDATGPQGYCSIQCAEAHVIAVDPTDPSTVFAGGRDDLWRCRNCGPSPTWTNIRGTHPDYRILAWSGNRLLAGNDGGVASTIDRGDTWQNHNATLSTVQLFSGALHPTNLRMVLTGSKDNGCLVWTEGNSWTGTHTPHGVCEGDVAISSSHPDTDWMASADFGEISRSRDGGLTWNAAVSGISEPVSRFTAAVRKCPSNDDVFLTGNTSLWRTTDFFSAANPTWSANGPSNAGNVRAIAFNEGDVACNTYAFGTRALGEDAAIWLTTNGGSSWTNVAGSATLPRRTVSSLAFDPRDSNILYAAFGNFDAPAPGRGGHVFKTANALSASPSWVNVSPPEDRPENVLIIDPKNPSRLYLGSDLGVWRSIDGAVTWTHMGPEVGMPNIPVHDLKIHPMTGEVFAFTFGRGVFVYTPQ